MKAFWIAGGWLALCGLASGYQAPAVPAGKGSIEGQVVSVATGAPLKRATVRVSGTRRTSDGLTPAVMVNKETDDQGRFAFTGMEAGRYQITVERQGYLRQSYGARKYSGGGSPLVLGVDQNVRNLVFKLAPQSVIAGKVLDEDGEAVANIPLRALKQGYRGGKKQWVQAGSGQTSDIGEFRIPNLDPGRYIVSANPGNRAQNMMQTASGEPLPETPELVFAATYYPSATDSAVAVPVDVPAGSEIRGIDVRLRRTRVFRVRGTVAGIAAGGRGGQVMVMLSPKDGPQGPQMMAPARQPDNRFEIRGVLPGSYILHTEVRGGTQAVAMMPLEVAGNHVDNVVLNVAPGNDIPVSVKLEDGKGGEVLTNVSVGLQPMLPMGGAPRAKIGEGLKGTLKNVAPMRYRVSVSGMPEGTFVRSINYAGVDIPDEGVEMLSASPLDVTLSATAGEISAAVVDRDGKPMPNVLVALYGSDGKSTRSINSSDVGAAIFRGLKPGDYRLMAFEDIPPGAHQDPDFVKPFESSGTSVKLEPSGKQMVQVKVIPVSETEK